MENMDNISHDERRCGRELVLALTKFNASAVDDEA